MTELYVTKAIIKLPRKNVNNNRTSILDTTTATTTTTTDYSNNATKSHQEIMSPITNTTGSNSSSTDYYYNSLVSEKLYLDGLANFPEIAEKDIMDLVKSCEPVKIYLSKNSYGSSSFIQFKTKEMADRAYTLLNGVTSKPGSFKLQLRINPPLDDFSEPEAHAEILHIKNLPSHTNNKSLYELFRPFGPMILCRILVEQGSTFKGSALVQYFNSQHAHDAEINMNNKTVQDNAISVSPFISSKSKTATNSIAVATTAANTPTTNTTITSTTNSQDMTRSVSINTAATLPVVPAPSLSSNDIRSDGSSMVDYTNLYIKNLDLNVKSADLFNHFRKFGRIISARVMKNAQTKQSKGFGFVSFSKADEAQKAKQDMNGEYILSKPVVVAFHEPRKMVTNSNESPTTPVVNTRYSPPAVITSPTPNMPNMPPFSSSLNNYNNVNNMPAFDSSGYYSDNIKLTSTFNNSKVPSRDFYSNLNNTSPVQSQPQKYNYNNTSNHNRQPLQSVPLLPHNQNDYHLKSGSHLFNNQTTMERNSSGNNRQQQQHQIYLPTNYNNNSNLIIKNNNNPHLPPTTSLSSLASGAFINTPPPNTNRHMSTNNIHQHNDRPTFRRRGSVESLASIMTESTTQKKHHTITKAVLAVEKGSISHEHIYDVVDMLLTLKKKDLATCLFNQVFLKAKIKQAKDALDIFQEQQGSHIVSVPSLPPAATTIMANNTDIGGTYTNSAVVTPTAINSGTTILPPRVSRAIPIVAPPTIITTDAVVVAASNTTASNTATVGTTASLLNNESIKVNGMNEKGPVKEIERFLATLKGLPSHEQKQSFGDKLFPLVKSTGVKQAPKITIRLLDTVPLKELAYTMYDKKKLKDHVQKIALAMSSQ